MYLPVFDFWLWSFRLQFQLVADLFHEKEDGGSAKSSRVNVRAAKSVPKAPNKDHRKTVGHQVTSQPLSVNVNVYLSDANAIGLFPF